MKANRKFISGEDEAVSPVIAVILMVAITVVLAATVYVWVSGFGAQSSNPAKTISVTSDGPIASTVKTYTIASASPGLKWGDLDITLDGATQDHDEAAVDCSTFTANFEWITCSGATVEDDDDTVNAGDTLKITGAASGQTLRVLDANANSVILTLTLG